MKSTGKFRKSVRLGSLAVLFVSVVLWGSRADAFVIGTLCDPACTTTQGWDGPGLGSATIDWHLGNVALPNGGLPAGVTFADTRAELLSAMAAWSSVVQVAWNEVGAENPVPGSWIYFASGAHGAGPPSDPNFDGAWNPNAATGRVLAHAWGPPDISGFDGNMHLDADETWVTAGASIGANSATIDLQSIFLHELGHVLGLFHEDGLGSGLAAPVMQSLYWGELRALHADDIAGMQSLYCPTGQTCNGGPSVIPEPSTILLLGAGLVGLGLWGRKRMVK